MHTKSELVFEEYCRERGYQAERITPDVNAGQFPDYRLITPAGPVIVEIKEFTPNDDDRSFVEALKTLGRADNKRSIGKRVRSAIRDSASQLRRYKETAFPEVLLLYDNIHNPFSTKRVWPRYFPHPSDRHYIKTGHPDTTGWDWSQFIGDRQSA